MNVVREYSKKYVLEQNFYFFFLLEESKEIYFPFFIIYLENDEEILSNPRV